MKEIRQVKEVLVALERQKESVRTGEVDIWRLGLQ